MASAVPLLQQRPALRMFMGGLGRSGCRGEKGLGPSSSMFLARVGPVGGSRLSGDQGSENEMDDAGVRRREPSSFRWSASLVLATFCLLFLPRGAHGYLDPGTGSFIVQVLIAILLGGIMTVRRAWSRIASHGKRLLRLGPDSGAEDG